MVWWIIINPTPPGGVELSTITPWWITTVLVPLFAAAIGAITGGFATRKAAISAFRENFDWERKRKTVELIVAEIFSVETVLQRAYNRATGHVSANNMTEEEFDAIKTIELLVNACSAMAQSGLPQSNNKKEIIAGLKSLIEKRDHLLDGQGPMKTARLNSLYQAVVQIREQVESLL